MKQFILDLDFLTTKEFCEKYDVPLPVFSKEKTKEELAFEFITLDAIKYKMIVEKAKKNKTSLKLEVNSFDLPSIKLRSNERIKEYRNSLGLKTENNRIDAGDLRCIFSVLQEKGFSIIKSGV